MNTNNGLRFSPRSLAYDTSQTSERPTSQEGRTTRALRSVRFVMLALTISVMLTSVGVLAGTGAVLAQADQDADSGTYTVQRGDSWTVIAERNGLSVEELKAANPQAIRANDWLNIGEEITIPGNGSDNADGEVGTDVGTDADEATVHIVSGGESWNSIANLYGVAVSDLMNANRQVLRESEVLLRGDELTIPIDREGQDDAGIDESDLQDQETETADDVSAEIDEATAGDTAPEETADEDADTASDTTSSEPASPEATATPEQEPAPEVEDVAEATPVDDAATDDEASDDGSMEDDMPAEPAAADGPQTYVVQPGESWNSIARKLGIDPSSLLAANTETVRPGEVLYTGDVLIVPSAADDVPADSEAPDEESADGGESDTAPEGEDVAAVELPSCPELFSEYPQALTAVINSPAGGPEGLATWLDDCGALSEEAIVTQDWTADGVDDLLVVYTNPIASGGQVSDLVIFNATIVGDDSPLFDAKYRARAGGDVAVLATEDINDDGQADIVWLDTTCGASTCFDTVNVRSWNGSTWADWTDGTITMAFANVDLEDISEDGQGSEIVATGGMYGSVGAGPQRARTETWASVGGNSYTLIDQTFSSSECLYHTVMDGNRALLNADMEGFGAAEAYFTDAIGNNNLTKCWVRDNELEELRTFSYFRLAQIAAYQDLPEVAGDVVAALKELYPESEYAKLAQVWLDAYNAGDVESACTAALAYAEETPIVWAMFADYGYTNPTFSAEGLCPQIGEDEPEVIVDEGTEAADATDSAAVDESESTPEPADVASTEMADASGEDDSEIAESEADLSDAPADAEITEEAAEPDSEIAPVDSSLPECPPNVDRFARILPDLLVAKEGDVAAVEAWLESCEATGGAENLIVTVDLNEDNTDDVVVFPTIISDLGFGPGGSQGSLLVYHGQEDGSVELAYEPEIYGQPTFLAAEDLNDDDQIELAWIVESCAAFCVIEVQMVSWNGSEYESAIEPGATIAVGTARFEPVGNNTAGAGQSLVLEGGVSGQPDGGLATSHTEIWQSIEGAPFQRVDWIYDREAEGNDCLGLRLVEADMALHASDAIGYGKAIDLYSQALDPSLLACSLYGIPGDDELILLQGLASFRLMQAQALDGDTIAARATLLALQAGQPDADYTRAATQWLETYTATGNAANACSDVESIFAENEDLWKITDHFGYNHPALPAQQICFVPE